MSVLTDALVKKGLVTREQLADAKDKQFGAKKTIGALLVEMGFISEAALMETTAAVSGCAVVDLEQQEVDPSALKLISYETAKRYSVFPLRRKDATLIVAASDPQDFVAIDDLKLSTRLEIELVLAADSQINRYIEKYYNADDVIYDLLKNFSDNASLDTVKVTPIGQGTFDEAAGEDSYSPVVKLVHLILHDAVKSRASDIHIEPQERFVQVRYRIDGDLKEIMTVPTTLLPKIVARIKVVSNLDIAETRKPQDGRARMFYDQRKIDLRVSTVPTFNGEKVVMRILDPQEAKIELDVIGFEEHERTLFVDAARKTQGIVLVTGPTGSGKTSTLYAALNFVKDGKKNITTIEDPIEYSVDGINQIQINTAKDLTFAAGLRSILRQDPNVILVGEIRDQETADIAFKSSLTGHLVLSTLHTNSSVATITRLFDMGLEPYLIASSVIMVLAQRLVKVICPACKEAYIPDAALLERYKLYIEKFGIKEFYHGKGCRQCDFTGYFGRTAVFEALKVNDRIRELISTKAPEAEMFKEAQADGLRTLAESGISKVAKALTTLEEVSRVADVVEADLAMQQKKSPGLNKMALIADDDEDILKMVEKRLQSIQFSVTRVRDGEELVKTAMQLKPDLIVTDVTMPRMNGFEATKILRSKMETALIPILMLTGREDKESELKGIDSGADDYLTKPFDSEKLMARVKMLMRRRPANA